MQLSNEHLDALGEVVNIGVGRAAASLSELLGTRIELRVPQIEIRPKLESQRTEIAILQNFDGNVSGTALLAFPTESGQQLAKMLGGYELDEVLSAIELSGILSEVGNIVLNGVLGSMANMIDDDLKYSVPDFFVDRPIESLIQKTGGDSEASKSLVVADTDFNVRSRNISGSIVLAFELGSLNNLLNRLIGASLAE